MQNHPDHLASSSYITNLAGEITQHMEYLPFGETLVEEHLNSNNSPYKFNAKELDAETGNYYYGARYYDPKFSIWLSIDPLAEMMPSWSPYNYAFSNPIFYIDPDGLSPDSYYKDKDGNVQYTATTSSEAEFNNSGIEGEYIAEEFIGIDQNQSVTKFNKDGTTNSSSQENINGGIKVMAIQSETNDLPNNSISVNPDKSGNAGKLNQFAKEMIEAGPQALQDFGNATSLVGYGLTLTVVGAPVGVTLATAGNGISTAGSVWEAGNKLADGNLNGSALDATFIVGGAVLSSQVTKIPGASQLTKEILKQNTNLKIELIKSQIDK